MGKYPIPSIERERQYSEEHKKKNETLVYFVDPKRLDELYPTIKKGTKAKKKNWKWKNDKDKGENEKMKINMKIVREELEKGLDKHEIAKKHGASLKIVGMLISKVQKADNEKKQSSPVNIETPERTQEKISPFVIEIMDIQGQMFKYRIQGPIITLIKENHSMKIQKSDIDSIIEELQQLKGVVG